MQTLADEAAWFDSWEDRLSCWWISLPKSEQAQLSSCVGALGVTLGSRLEAAWRLGGDMWRTSAGSQPPSTSEKNLAEKNLAEPGCMGWIEDKVEHLGLPDFPPLTSDMALGDVLGQFQLPPLFKLLPLPWGVQRWQELGRDNEQSHQPQLQPQASTVTSHWAPTAAASAGGVAGALVALLGLRVAAARRGEPRQHRQPATIAESY